VVQTVEPAAQALSLPVRTRWELREWDDGLSYTGGQSPLTEQITGPRYVRRLGRS